MYRTLHVAVEGVNHSDVGHSSKARRLTSHQPDNVMHCRDLQSRKLVVDGRARGMGSIRPCSGIRRTAYPRSRLPTVSPSTLSCHLPFNYTGHLGIQ